MADVQIVKRPAGGAYGQFMNANRTSLAEQAAKEGLTGVTAVTKKASELWKAMTDEEKAPWEAKFKEAQAAYMAYKDSDSFVPPEKKEKRGKKEEKKEKDPEAPKKPVGGAYGVFQNEKRAEFMKIAEEKGEKGFGPLAKMISEAFKLLSEEDRKVYEEKAAKAMEEYKLLMTAYREKTATEAPEARDDATAGKRSRAAISTPPKAAKRGRGAVKSNEIAGPCLPADLLAAAEKEGLREALENLARRPDITAKKCDAAEMLKTLKQCGGLVNKAKAALLGA